MKRMRVWVFFWFLLAAVLFPAKQLWAANVTIKEKPQKVTASQKGEMHILKVKKSSLVEVTAYGSQDSTEKKNIKIVCQDSKKKTISPTYTTNVKKTALFTLKPGKYYIRVKSSAPSYFIYAISKPFSNQGGSSMKKAKKISLNKTTYGIVFHKDSWKKKHWYTIHFTKAKRVRLVLKKAGGKVGYKLSGPEKAKEQIKKLTGKKGTVLPAGDYVLYFAKPNKKAAKDGAIYSFTFQTVK